MDDYDPKEWKRLEAEAHERFKRTGTMRLDGVVPKMREWNVIERVVEPQEPFSEESPVEVPESYQYPTWSLAGGHFDFAAELAHHFSEEETNLSPRKLWTDPRVFAEADLEADYSHFYKDISGLINPFCRETFAETVLWLRTKTPQTDTLRARWLVNAVVKWNITYCDPQNWLQPEDVPEAASEAAYVRDVQLRYEESRQGLWKPEASVKVDPKVIARWITKSRMKNEIARLVRSLTPTRE